jgi:hypothetical protein
VLTASALAACHPIKLVSFYDARRALEFLQHEHGAAAALAPGLSATRVSQMAGEVMVTQ